jgi:hypothetical protein
VYKLKSNTKPLYGTAAVKKPAQRSLKQVALSLAVFIKRLQAESNWRCVNNSPLLINCKLQTDIMRWFDSY